MHIYEEKVFPIPQHIGSNTYIKKEGKGKYQEVMSIKHILHEEGHHLKIGGFRNAQYQ